MSSRFEVCDRINFLSGGEIVYDARTADTTVTDLINLVTRGYKAETPDPLAVAAARELS